MFDWENYNKMAPQSARIGFGCRTDRNPRRNQVDEPVAQLDQRITKTAYLKVISKGRGELCRKIGKKKKNASFRALRSFSGV